MDLQRFREVYANQSGVVESVCPCLYCSQGSELLYSRNQLNFYTTSRTNPADQIFIFFSEERSVGVKTMRKCVHWRRFFELLLIPTFARLLSILEEKSIQRGIIVFPGNMTPSARKVS